MTISIAEALALRAGLPGDCPDRDLELLLCFVLDVNSAYLRTWPEKALSPDQSKQLRALVDERIRGVPVAHLIGSQAFWTLDLEVSSETLIPRQDTERLVELALALDLPSDAKVLDLGTGTGAIALSLASEMPAWSVLASDFKPEIVDLAERNAKRHGLENVSFSCSSWFASIEPSRFDLIVSNPPYIARNDPHLSQGDLRFEAHTALVADQEGYADIRHICDRARTYLKPEGVLMFEHGYDQGAGVRKLMTEFGYREPRTEQDWARNDRVTLGYAPSCF